MKLNDPSVVRTVLNDHLLGVFGNIWFRMIRLSEGEFTGGEVHDYKHITLVCAGSIMSVISGEDDRVYKAGDVCLLAETVEHGFRGLEDNTLVCSVAVVRDAENTPVAFDDCMNLPLHTPQFNPVNIHPNFFIKE